MSMQSLAELFPALLEEHLDRPEIQEGIVKIAWKQCVGQRIREMSNPAYFQNGILTVEVSNPQWKSILESMKTNIVTRINNFIKKPLLKDVRIIVV
jgi:predicted nucleic acid-binding Zn ribbon protein